VDRSKCMMGMARESTVPDRTWREGPMAPRRKARYHWKVQIASQTDQRRRAKAKRLMDRSLLKGCYMEWVVHWVHSAHLETARCPKARGPHRYPTGSTELADC
jgi:hypothetical protein